LAEGHPAGDLERELVRVDRVELAVEEAGLDALDGVARQRAAIEGALDALLHARDELPRDGAALDVVHELEARLALVRRELDLDVGELAAPAGLLLVRVLVLDGRADGLAVGDLRLAHVGLDLELALEAVHDDLEVELAHAGDDRLARLLVGGHLRSE